MASARTLYFLLVSLALLLESATSAFCCRATGSTTVQSIQLSRTVLLHSNPYPWEEATPSQDGDEETLLRLRLSLKPNVSMDEALRKVQAFKYSMHLVVCLYDI